MSDELERLEEILERRAREEPYGGILPIPSSTKIERLASRIYSFMRSIEEFLKKSQNVPKVRGCLLGLSLIVVCIVSLRDVNLSIGLLVFLLTLNFLFYPEMAMLISRFFTHVIYDLVKKGTIASILTPREIVEKLRSVEYIFFASLPLLVLVFFPGTPIVFTLRIIGTFTVVISAIAYYYLKMALECWERPTRRISESDIISLEFLVLVSIFIMAAVSLYLIMPPELASVYGWIITILSYAFISVVIAVPSFQAALHVTTLWRGIDTRRLFEEIERHVRWV